MDRQEQIESFDAVIQHDTLADENAKVRSTDLQGKSEMITDNDDTVPQSGLDACEDNSVNVQGTIDSTIAAT